VQTIVQTAAGAVSGTGAAVRVFRGIPFAAPPLGALRWRPPQPLEPWTGVRDGAHFGPDPMQLDDPARGSRAPGMSEDCLTLNVWAPADVPPGGAPVLVWFDGGGFTAASGARACTDGERFAERGAVLVTANYRVGAFGFLAHPALTAESPHAASGNYGLLDAIAALRWVRANIAAFGGDPARVTAFGESAGGALVALLLTSPLATGAFDRAILQSPGSFRPLCRLSDAESAGRVAGDDLAALRAAPASDILALNARINPAVRGLTVGRPLRPIVDGWSVPRDEVGAFRSGEFSALPAIVGGNADEGAYFAAGVPVGTPEQLRAYLEQNFGADAGAAWGHYGATTAGDAVRAAREAFGDAQFSYGARSLAREIARRQPRTFRYVFTYAGTHTADPPTHADEIAYVFGSGDFDARDRAVSDAMLAAWIAFAATGDPNGPGAPAWPPFEEHRDNYLEFGPELRTGTHWRSGALDFIERFYRSREA
jgi:para-nitrobenzyl esterase